MSPSDRFRLLRKRVFTLSLRRKVEGVPQRCTRRAGAPVCRRLRFQRRERAPRVLEQIALLDELRPDRVQQLPQAKAFLQRKAGASASLGAASFKSCGPRRPGGAFSVCARCVPRRRAARKRPGRSAGAQKARVRANPSAAPASELRARPPPCACCAPTRTSSLSLSGCPFTLLRSLSVNDAMAAASSRFSCMKSARRSASTPLPTNAAASMAAGREEGAPLMGYLPIRSID